MYIKSRNRRQLLRLGAYASSAATITALGGNFADAAADTRRSGGDFIDTARSTSPLGQESEATGQKNIDIQYKSIFDFADSIPLKSDFIFDATSALGNALNNAPEGTVIHIPTGSYVITSDILWPIWRRISLIGDGQSTSLKFVDCGITLSSTSPSDHNRSFNRIVLEKVSLQRVGKSGDLITFAGSAKYGVARWAMRDVFVRSADGTGMKIQGSWIGLMENVFINGCSIGVNIVPDTETNSTSMNALTVIGGETQGCIDGWKVQRCDVLKIVGHCIEGCTRGITSMNLERCIDIDGCYFESNKDYDISMGGGAPGMNNSVHNSLFKASRNSTSHAIYLRNGYNFLIENNVFYHYTGAGIQVGDSNGGIATGVVRRNSLFAGTPKEVDVIPSATAFGEKRAIRHFNAAAAIEGSLTSFGQFVAEIPSDVSGTTTISLEFLMTSGSGGDVFTDCVIRDSSGASIAKSPFHLTSKIPHVGAIATAIQHVDLRSYAGQVMIFEFRRRGDLEADTWKGNLSYLHGEIVNLTSEVGN